MLRLVRREEKKREKMSGTVDYVKVVDLLVDTIKELNVPCADTEAAIVPMPTAPDSREDDRRADAVSLLRNLLNELEGGAGANGANGAAAAAAAAEHSAASQQLYKSGESHFYTYFVPGKKVNGRAGPRVPVSRPCANKDAHKPKDCR